MSVLSTRRLAASGSSGVAASCGVLASAVLVLYAAAGYASYGKHGRVGLAAAALAAGVCWAGSTSALVLAGWLRNSRYATHGILGGTLLRTGIPLLAGAILHATGGPLARAGVTGWLLVFFLWTLVVETALVVRLARSAKSRSHAPGMREAS